MRNALIVLGTALLLPTYAAAQQGDRVAELGTRAVGADILTDGGTLTTVGIPGGGILGSPTIYLMFWPAPNVMVGPELNVNLATNSATLTAFGLAGWIGWLATPATPGSFYLAANGAFQFVDLGGFSNTDFGAGAAIGYRYEVLNQHLAIRAEGGYRRWFDSDLNEIVISLKLGLVFRRR
ncbi:MAG: hypothetical protein IH965_14950 [Gemmatimonadetes bacterium]|nr:hypothetical protein [Gemmatimonadota bacterium]